MKKAQSKINVLFVIVQMKMGGSEHLVWDLVRKLDRNKFKPHVAWFYEEEPLQVFSDLDIPLYYIPKRKRLDFGTMRHLSKTISENNIDVVNAHHYLSMIYSFYGAKIQNRICWIYTEHSEWEIQAISRKWRVTGKAILRFSDAVVGISVKVKDCLKNSFKLSRKKVYAIPNGVDCNLFNVANDKKKYKEQLGLPQDDIVIGIVANLKKNKNHIFLLKAFERLRKSNDRIKLLLIGQAFKGDKESSEEGLKNFIKNRRLEDSVLLLGERSDVPEILQCLDIFCLTSFKEGLPISLIEAMACGLPVIGTNVDGIKDVVTDGENGFLVELNDVDELELALQKLIDSTSLRRHLGDQARKLVVKYYSLNDCIKKYEELFEKKYRIIKRY